MLPGTMTPSPSYGLAVTAPAPLRPLLAFQAEDPRVAERLKQKESPCGLAQWPSVPPRGGLLRAERLPWQPAAAQRPRGGTVPAARPWSFGASRTADFTLRLLLMLS